MATAPVAYAKRAGAGHDDTAPVQREAQQHVHGWQQEPMGLQQPDDSLQQWVGGQTCQWSELPAELKLLLRQGAGSDKCCFGKNTYLQPRRDFPCRGFF